MPRTLKNIVKLAQQLRQQNVNANWQTTTISIWDEKTEYKKIQIQISRKIRKICTKYLNK